MGRKVDGDMVMFLVSMITSKPENGIDLKPENIPIVMSKMPRRLRENKEVEKLVTAIMNG